MEVLLGPPQMGEADWTKDFTLDEFISTTPMPRKPVPNHLTDTKIFSSIIKKNALIKVDPTVIHFPGFSLGKTQKKKFKICNSSSERQNMHIVSPSTKYFTVKYTKPRRFVPGFTMDVTVFFTPDEWRYYYDCIRLHCEGEENIIIPLHAYPIMDLSGFPEKMVFDTASTRLGKTRRKLLSLKSPHPVDFEYKINILQPHPSFTVKPLSGTIPGEGEALVSVIYTPTEYVTSHMTMQLKVSEFNSKPLVTSVIACCVPNPHKKSIKESDEMFKKTKILDPYSLSLVQISRRRKTAPPQPPTRDEIERDGLFFPSQIHTQHAVNSVLIQKAGKLRAKDMRDAASSTLARKDGRESTPSIGQTSSRQMKEAAFKQELTKDEIEERANHLRWQVHRGSQVITEDEHLEILRERERMQIDYKYRRRCEPDDDTEIQRYITFKAMRRTFRESKSIPEIQPNFDLYNDNPWLSRHRALERFQQAARTILIRKRADKKVKLLRIMIENFKNGTLDQQVSAESTTQLQLDARHQTSPSMASRGMGVHFSISAAKVKPFTFPVYVESESKDSLTTNEVTEVESVPSTITLQQNVPFHLLKVPKQYEMLGYNNSNVDQAARSYVSTGIACSLRGGAEDEIIEVAIPPHLLSEDEQKASPTKDVDPDSRPESRLSKGPENLEKETMHLVTSGVNMPSELLSNPPHHPLHIFNPFPGMQAVYLPFNQSEVDPDYHLCPMPRYSMLPNGDPYFDKDDVIKGLMTWKKFPSQGIVALSKNNGTIPSASLPRWSDPFGEGMLPNVIPDLLSPITEPLEEAPDFWTSAGSFELTPGMVKEEFKVVEDEIVTAAQEEEDEREYKAPDMMKSVESHDNTLQLKILEALDKFENLDKSQPTIYYS